MINEIAISEILFWVFFIFIIYTYFGYGVILFLISILFPRPVKKQDIFPNVTIIIAAYNEETAIKSKIDNTLALDYPPDKLEIIIGSDASADRTDEIVKEYPSDRVRLIRVEGRQGKTGVQNECVKSASGEIIVFTDATTILLHDSVRNLVRNFADNTIGCVGAKLIYVNPNQTQLGQGGTSYWSYETFIKKLESNVNSLIGVSGCFYALRKTLYEPVSRHLISDFVVALHTFKKGYRVLFEETAICKEETLENTEDELSMRVRVALRTYTALFEERDLLNPFRYGLFAFQLLSHKVLRYSVGIFMIGIFFTNLFLLDKVFYQITMIGQILFYVIAVIAHYKYKRDNKKGLFSIPYYLALTNIAALLALFRFIKGESVMIWEPKR
jgi:cellulose synthase/poly-beta-1,6-N-acetylglucosamine synthase-like glycosyltransferase